MNRILVSVVFLPLMLSACAPASSAATDASVPDNPDARAAQAVVQKYMAAGQSQSYDANALVALYADDATWTSRGETSIGTIDRASFKDFFSTYWNPPDRQVRFVSYLVISDGSAALVEAILSRTSSLTNKMVSAPATIILEIKNGQIERETWYYNEDLIH